MTARPALSAISSIFARTESSTKLGGSRDMYHHLLVFAICKSQGQSIGHSTYWVSSLRLGHFTDSHARQLVSSPSPPPPLSQRQLEVNHRTSALFISVPIISSSPHSRSQALLSPSLPCASVIWVCASWSEATGSSCDTKPQNGNRQKTFIFDRCTICQIEYVPF